MLGEVICEETGTITGTRELTDSKVELSLETAGQINGVDETTEWTYWSETRQDGTLYREGEGVMTTVDGDVLQLQGSGSAKSVAEDGSIAYRGVWHFHTESEKHAALNGGVGVFTYDVDADGATQIVVWEWS